MEHLTDLARCKAVTDKHLDYFTFDIDQWFRTEGNYTLIEDENIAFGQLKSRGVYWVHFCFHTAKGREAIDLTRRMFKEFCRACPVETAIGIINMKNKKARWLIRQVGFKSLGEVDTEKGLCEMFYSKRVD